MNTVRTKSKKKYQTPALNKMGTIKQLTFASGSFGGDAGIQQTP